MQCGELIRTALSYATLRLPLLLARSDAGQPLRRHIFGVMHRLNVLALLPKLSAAKSNERGRLDELHVVTGRLLSTPRPELTQLTRVFPERIVACASIAPRAPLQR